MAQVVSFEGYVPAARYDAVAWAEAQVWEAADPNGAWTKIDTITLDPVDTDPSRPAARSFTTAAGTAAGLWYRVVFADGVGGESLPTDPVQNLQALGSDYITLDSLKDSKYLRALNFADADLRRAITAASRGVDTITKRRFWLDADDTQVRYYHAEFRSHVEIDDLVALTAFDTDPNGDNSFSRSWTIDDDFYLEPLNALADGEPYTEIRSAGTLYLPTWRARGVRVTGQFGWPAIPAGVTTATTILAGRLLERQRGTAPLGVITVGIEAGAVARIGRSDPDVMNALAAVIRTQALIS